VKVYFSCLFVLVIVSCGGQPKSNSVSVLSDPQLKALWQDAQTVIATQPIMINAALVAEGKEQPIYFSPDLSAYNINPDGVTVIPVEDNGTGVIKAPNNVGGVAWCHSYLQGSEIYVAASMMYNSGTTGYEMQNYILSKLGFNVSQR
jgi:hypothetical protein